MGLDLFTPVVPPEDQHHHFKELISGYNDPEREALARWAGGFVDRDGKFVQEFQTTFWSSFWEIYLYAGFRALGYEVDLTHPSPDFLLSRTDATLVAEAAVAREAEGYVSEQHRRPNVGIPRPDMRALLEYATLRLSNAFASKLAKYRERYAALPHVTGKPFVVCLTPFEQPMAFLQSIQAMQRVLYTYDGPVWGNDALTGERTIVGESRVESVEKDSGENIPLGYFSDRRATEVSAIIFSTTASIAKLRGVAEDQGQQVFFEVTRYNAHHARLTTRLLDKARYRETLLDGLHIMLNPFAAHALDVSPFRGREVSIHHGYSAEHRTTISDIPHGALIGRSTMVVDPRRPGGPPRYGSEPGLKEPTTRVWPDGELKPTGGQVETLGELHMAHYHGWTVLVACDLLHRDWTGQAIEGTHRDLGAFIAARSGAECQRVEIGMWAASKETARDFVLRRIDRHLSGAAPA
jgi:hypothetical protein